jgi:hypothetical protein
MWCLMKYSCKFTFTVRIENRNFATNRLDVSFMLIYYVIMSKIIII